MDDTCIFVFTSRSIDRMLSEGGCRSWVLDAKRARKCKYLVCAWNSMGEHAEESKEQRHGRAYIVAPITSIEPVLANRFSINFDEFARIKSSAPAWHGGRNPIHYTTLNNLGINIKSLTFEAPHAPNGTPAEEAASPILYSNGEVVPLTIAAAKRGLAIYYGVKPEAIKIVIRG